MLVFGIMGMSLWTGLTRYHCVEVDTGILLAEELERGCGGARDCPPGFECVNHFPAALAVDDPRGEKPGHEGRDGPEPLPGVGVEAQVALFRGRCHERSDDQHRHADGLPVARTRAMRAWSEVASSVVGQGEGPGRLRRTRRVSEASNWTPEKVNEKPAFDVFSPVADSGCAKPRPSPTSMRLSCAARPSKVQTR